jgi:hypothetical protein
LNSKKKVFHELENIFRDIFVNNEVISPYNASALEQTRYNLYKNKLYSQKDFLNFKFKDQK